MLAIYYCSCKHVKLHINYYLMLHNEKKIYIYIYITFHVIKVMKLHIQHVIHD